jgi:hypothetical protein
MMLIVPENLWNSTIFNEEKIPYLDENNDIHVVEIYIEFSNKDKNSKYAH